MELGVAQSLGLAHSQRGREKAFIQGGMGKTREAEFVSSRLVQVRFDEMWLLMVNLWGRCGISVTGGF